MTYEELAADPPGHRLHILDWLGLQIPQNNQLKTTHKRRAGHVNTDWICAYKSH